MAGRGSRFSKAGYTFPKPIIDVNGEPMISLVTKNLLEKCVKEVHVIYICQEEHYNKYDLENVLNRAVKDAGINKSKVSIIKINNITQGAACTALMAKDVINLEHPLMIANSDQFIKDPVMCAWHDVISLSDNDGEIMCFKSSHPKWSYARLDENGYVLEIAEKKVISDFATTGIYWWKKAKDFIDSAEDMIVKDIRHNNEFYIAPTYNEMILNNKKISIMEINPEYMQGLGDPESLKGYLSQTKNML
jgi:dTDP-glucose pyrophosphorylase